jgi:hypothetical protein
VALYDLQASSLLARAIESGLSKHRAAAAIARAALRYEAAAAGGQHLGLPRTHYEALYAANVRNEGFASPFNSRMVVLGRTDTKFCSLFIDTDRVFGSIGGFFDTDLHEYPGGWTINPPYIETLMAKAYQHVHKFLIAAKEQGQPFVAFCLLPGWNDSLAVRSFVDSEFVSHVVNLKPFKYALEEPNGRQFLSPFAGYYVVLSAMGPKEEYTLAAENATVIPGSLAAHGGGPKQYAIISGEISNDAREKIKNVLNSPENLHGGIIKALLISKTGAEGLDLKNIRETHQLEPYWDKARDDQVKSRAVRIGSHDALPREERVVQPYLYLAVANSRMQKNKEKKTVDEMFYERALEHYELNNEFRRLLTEVSIECSAFAYSDHCRVCAPTNAPLFHEDPASDTRRLDPCEEQYETKVEAISIRHKNNDYYYSPDSSAALGFTFYTKREDLGGWAKLDPSDPLVLELLPIAQEGTAKLKVKTL